MSAFFSGTETAFFNLSRRQLESFQKSTHKVHRLVYNLMQKPRILLNSILFGNMMVNIFFFAISSSLTLTVKEELGNFSALVMVILTFTLLVLSGEILPKSFAYTNSWRLSIISALPLYFIVKIFFPITHFLELIIVQPVLRLLVPFHNSTHKQLSLNQLKNFLDTVKDKGLVTESESNILGEVLEMKYIKARHIMSPRVDMVFCDIESSIDYATELMFKNHKERIPVFSNSIDNIVGVLHLRKLLLNPSSTIKKIMEKPFFIPEQQGAEKVLDTFRTNKIELLIVVDEYGGIAGQITTKDLIEEILGPSVSYEIPPVNQIGPMKYEISGDQPLHEWYDVLGIEIAESRFTTFAGFIAHLLGKIPVEGDKVTFNNLTFIVNDVSKARIKKVLLELGTNI